MIKMIIIYTLHLFHHRGGGGGGGGGGSTARAYHLAALDSNSTNPDCLKTMLCLMRSASRSRSLDSASENCLRPKGSRSNNAESAACALAYRSPRISISVKRCACATSRAQTG